MTSHNFSKRLLHWFDLHGRKNLPWQQSVTPYRVWVSEIMLQQTQVDTVIPYFERFMARFADVESLAAAPLDDVLHLWTGLGYYARARNLHTCAQKVVTDHRGEFPAELGELMRLPGIGRSTAAAIASIAFNQPTAILDGNVKRVLARHCAVDGWPGNNAVAVKLWQAAEAFMPLQRCRDYTQAIMDLGATVCTRSKPRCQECPVHSDCQAYAAGTPTAYPASKPTKAKPSKDAYLLLLQLADGRVLLEQRPALGIWGGLWSLPEADLQTDLQTYISQHFGTPASLQPWPSLRHSFSHYHFNIHPVHVTLQSTRSTIREGHKTSWVNPLAPIPLGLAAPVKALLTHLQQPLAHPTFAQQQTLAL